MSVIYWSIWSLIVPTKRRNRWRTRTHRKESESLRSHRSICFVLKTTSILVFFFQRSSSLLNFNDELCSTLFKSISSTQQKKKEMIFRRDSLIFEALQIVLLCLVWYGEYRLGCWDFNDFSSLFSGVSAAGNVIVKALMNEFPFPLTVTLAQLFSVWMLSIPLLK